MNLEKIYSQLLPSLGGTETFVMSHKYHVRSIVINLTVSPGSCYPRARVVCPRPHQLVSGVARITPHVSDSWLRRMWFIHSLGESEAGVAISLCLGAWGHEPKVTVKAPRAGPGARGLLCESAAWEIGTLGGKAVGGAGSWLQAQPWHVEPVSEMRRPSE